MSQVVLQAPESDQEMDLSNIVSEHKQHTSKPAEYRE